MVSSDTGSGSARGGAETTALRLDEPIEGARRAALLLEASSLLASSFDYERT
jgi:hypothetical protein